MRGICPQERISYCVSFLYLRRRLGDFCPPLCAHANKLMVRRVLHMLGPGLSTRLGISPCTWLLPYVYCTIKSKCFLSGRKSVRIWKEIGHSCARKICSYVKWPRRIVWKRIHRCAEHLAKEMRPGAETWGLRDAAKGLKNWHSYRLVKIRTYVHGAVVGKMP